MSQPATPLLVLMRHGVTEDSAPDGTDAVRALTPGGHTAAARAAVGLIALGFHPDVVVTSPLVRCHQTAGLVADAAGCDLETDDRLAPGMTSDDLIEIVLEHPGAHTIVACSHQPGLSYALADLTGCGPIGFRRPGAAVIALRSPRVGGGSLIALLPPRILRAAAAMREGDDPAGGAAK
ncbi:MAG: phosphohistidine phosphatase SixA [Thermoleophilia bacterium]|nr:phosphohistidine phosphatase SixA [Thermoleophilia bacterium]